LEKKNNEIQELRKAQQDKQKIVQQLKVQTKKADTQLTKREHVLNAITEKLKATEKEVRNVH
jgi:peptidoglycan hydrolase CwlO-like protein